MLDLPVAQGILVARTTNGDSFSEAGIRGGRRTYRVGNRRLILGGDIIVEADGQKVDSIARLKRIVDNRRPGEAIELKIYRNGRPMTIAVTLLERTRYF
jgi:S1-C subfamily serine protease